MMSELQTGRMFLCGADPYRRIPVFLSGQAERCVVVIGGQSDGFFSLNYLGSLIKELSGEGWAVAQVQLASSLAGCPGNHISDGQDLDDVMGILLKQHNMKELTLFAFNTGVQIAIEFMEKGRNTELVTRVVLQGVIRDPEDELFSVETTYKRIKRAKELVAEGKGESYAEMAKLYDHPVSAARVASGGILSIQEAVYIPAVRGDVETLRSNLNKITVPLLIMCARQTEGSEQNKLKEVEKNAVSVIEQAASTKDISVSFFDEVCDERRRMLNTAQGKHTATVVMFLQQQDKNRKDREEAARQNEAEQLRRSRSILAKSSLAHTA